MILRLTRKLLMMRQSINQCHAPIKRGRRTEVKRLWRKKGRREERYRE